MARPLRIQYAGAIYHVMARGNGRQRIFHEDRDYQRMTDGLEKTVGRTGWEVFAFVWMLNHVHLLFRTPRPNLSKGMQYLLSGYANWYAKRHQRSGHLFQGRFKGELIEDESYLWTASRYLHLNPVRGKRPLVEYPVDWHWSSYRGYRRTRQKLEFIAYEVLYEAWRAKTGGKDPVRGYTRFVESGLHEMPSNPFAKAWEGWLLGSDEFVKKIKAKFTDAPTTNRSHQARALASGDPADIIQAVADYFAEDVANYRRRRSTARGRDLAAYLGHRGTTAALSTLAPFFGLTNPDSVSNLIRRAERSRVESPEFQRAERVILVGSIRHRGHQALAPSTASSQSAGSGRMALGSNEPPC